MDRKEFSPPDVQRNLDLSDLDPRGTLFETEEEAPVGAVVSIVERRRALEAIVDIYNQQARARGLGKAARMAKHRPDLEARYEDPDVISRNAHNKAKTLSRESNLGYHIRVLVNAHGMEIAGASPSEIAKAAYHTGSSVYESFGPDAGASKRKSRLAAVRER